MLLRYGAGYIYIFSASSPALEHPGQVKQLQQPLVMKICSCFVVTKTVHVLLCTTCTRFASQLFLVYMGNTAHMAAATIIDKLQSVGTMFTMYKVMIGIVLLDQNRFETELKSKYPM